MKSLFALFLISSVFTSCRTMRDSDLSINSGTLDVEHSYVVPLFISGTRFCSAVMIRPNVALSAAHCFDSYLRNKENLIHRIYTFANGKMFILDHVAMSRNFFTYSKSSSTHKSSKANGYMFDLAILKFEKPVMKTIVPLGESVLPLGTEGLNIVGFGCNDHLKYLPFVKNFTYFSTALKSYMFRWQSPVGLKLERYEAPRNSLVNSYVVSGQTKTKSINRYVTACSGDSGGALLYKNRLYGIASRTSEKESFYTSFQHRYLKDFIAKYFSGEEHSQRRVVKNAPKFSESFDIAAAIAKHSAREKFITDNEKVISKELVSIYRGAAELQKDRETRNRLVNELGAQSEKVTKKMLNEWTQLHAQGYHIFPPLFKTDLDKALTRNFTRFGTSLAECGDWKGMMRPVASPASEILDVAAYHPNCQAWPKWNFVFIPKYFATLETGLRIHQYIAPVVDPNTPQPSIPAVPVIEIVDPSTIGLSALFTSEQMFAREATGFLTKEKIKTKKFVVPVMNIKLHKDKVLYCDQIELLRYNGKFESRTVLNTND